MQDQCLIITDIYGVREKRRRKERKKKFFQIYMGSFGFSFKLIIFVFQKSMHILFTDMALPTIRFYLDQKLWSPMRLFRLNAAPFIDWTCTAEMTVSLQADLVLWRTSVSHNMFNRCCHFVYGDTLMWLKCTRKMQYLRKVLHPVHDIIF